MGVAASFRSNNFPMDVAASLLLERNHSWPREAVLEVVTSEFWICCFLNHLAWQAISKREFP